MKKNPIIFIGIAVVILIIILFIIASFWGKNKNVQEIPHETIVNEEKAVEDTSERNVIENDTEVYIFEEN